MKSILERLVRASTNSSPLTLSNWLERRDSALNEVCVLIYGQQSAKHLLLFKDLAYKEQ